MPIRDGKPHMKKLLLSATALSVLAAMTPGSASAADMPVRQRTPVVAAPAVVPEWTGFYVGGNAGGSIGVDAVSQNAVFTSDALGTNGLLSSSNRYVTTGWVYGGQVGYNWQISRWVLGVDADWKGMSQKDSASNCAPAATTFAFFHFGGSGFGYCLASEQKLTNLTTVRGRGGYLST